MKGISENKKKQNESKPKRCLHCLAEITDTNNYKNKNSKLGKLHILYKNCTKRVCRIPGIFVDTKAINKYCRK